MDVVRERKRRWPKYAIPAIGVIALGVASAISLYSMSHLRAQGVVIDRSTIVTDVAIRGVLVRTVSAQGQFKAEFVRVTSATQSGVVNLIMVKPGSVVQPGSIIAQMKNPALDDGVTSAKSQVEVAQANYASARQQARSAQLTQQTTLADARAQDQLNRLQANAYQTLHQKGLVASVPYQQAQIQARKSANDVDLSRAQLAVGMSDAEAKVAAAQAQVVQATALLAARNAQVAELTVRSATAGIVQSVEVDPGSAVAQNTTIAHIADIRSLKVVLQVAEGDVHSVTVGMTVRIDSGNGVLSGSVARIAPVAQNGTVAVDVALPMLPPGARPDANVDGTIQISKVRDALSIARPAGALDGTTLNLFKVVDDGRRAVRVSVRLGKGSNERVQVLSGIVPGDVVIVSDMSIYADQAGLRIQ
jgi:multidrug efflux pump subunit AcrA (membrane-fusion protein)